MNTEKIGNFIASKRKEKSMTQRELANRIGVTDRAVSKWERGLGCPDVTLLEELSEILGISIVELLNGESMEKPKIIEKDLIKSMRYSKEYTKSKIKNNTSVLLIAITVLASIILITLNIHHSYQLNVNNKGVINYYKEIQEKIANIDTYSNIILNNQGKYTDNEYKQIKSYIKKINNLLNDNINKYISKKQYNTKDYYEFIKIYDEVSMEKYNTYNKSLYHILIKYNINIIDRMLEYEKLTTKIPTISLEIRNEIKKSYRYDYISKDGINIIWLIHTTYLKEEMLLKDIIEVGDMNE